VTEADLESRPAPGFNDPPFLRVLQCFECKSMEVMPDYDPALPPAFDAVLHEIDKRHGGDTETPHYRTIERISEKAWENMPLRRQMVKQMWSETTGFTPAYYDARDTLKDDAVKCFQQHHRQVPCIDYQDSSKRLGNPAAADRARLAREMRDEDIKHSAIRIYLCNFCPVQVKVDQMKRDAGGRGIADGRG
jgi:hypothetical protein